MSNSIKWAALALSLTACVPAIEYTSDVVVIGDSNCFGDRAWAQIAGIESDCVAGRGTINIDSLPLVQTVIFALGTNDAIHDVPISDTRAQVNYLFSTTNADIHCLLPDNQNPLYADVRQVLIDACSNTIEPREYGFLFRAIDGIHGSLQDHRDLSISMTRYFVD